MSSLRGRDGMAAWDLALALELKRLWFPVLDLLFFWLGHHLNLSARQSLLRAPKVPIPGYYSLEVVLER